MSERKKHQFGDRHALCWPPMFDRRQPLPVARLRASILDTAPGFKTLFSQADIDYLNNTLFYSDRIEVARVGVGTHKEASLTDITYIEMPNRSSEEELTGVGMLRINLRNADEITFPIDTAGQLWWPRDPYHPQDRQLKLKTGAAIIKALNLFKDLAQSADDIESRIDSAIRWANNYGLMPMYRHWLAVEQNQRLEQPNPNIMTVRQFIRHWHNQGLI